MADGTFNRPRGQFEPRAHGERGREFGERQSRAPDQGATGRRDPGPDALLELARLIGESDPFAPVPVRASEAHKPEAHKPEPHKAEPHKADERVADAPRGSNAPDRGAQDPLIRPPALYPMPPQDRSNRLFEDRSSLDGSASNRRVQGPSIHPDPGHANEGFDFLQLSGRNQYPVVPRQAQADDGGYDHGDHHEDLLMAQEHRAYGKQDEYDDEYLEEDQEPDRDYEYDADHEQLEDESDSKRRSSTKIVVAILGLAVFGSAAAFGYRTMFKAVSSDPTPIIRADNSPTKVMPTGADASLKPTNDRMGERSGERLVSREEDPIDMGSSNRSGATGAVGTSGSSLDTAPTVNARTVRTVTIPPEQGAAPPERVAPQPAARALPPPPATPRQVAALPPPATSAPPPMASAPEAAAPAGGFVVQLSAQRSEAEAQTAFRGLQAKYSVLSGRQPLIRRKDQGERGIFYAAQVGPFSAKGEADQLCETLKAAGGACFVLKN